MHKDLPKHTVVLGQNQLATGTRDRTNDQGLDKLSVYDLHVLHLLVFVVKEMLSAPEFVYHSHLKVLKYPY